ncbi:thiamine phosphate synthase [Sphingomonas sp.]|uniref:thiamine phosphate synthase n=1 Tax=Sphingomonas sp. TaxID=28214 RepID=UPI001ECBB1E6|nr:thiamine phosphate synthase [Sphingomonas sp.]MBX3593616.1 thiamine phosphate synthase [Sphingomonas sp.]
MRARQSPRPPRQLPRQWLFTDPRLTVDPRVIARRLPIGTGIVMRHYDWPIDVRRQLFRDLRAIARQRRLVLVVAGKERLGPGAAGRHGRHRGALTAPVHSRREAMTAIRAGAKLVFASPVHATRSHPGARPLGRLGLALLIRDLPIPVVALGGMDARRWRALRPLDVHGWAGIDAWRSRARRV